MATKQEGAAEFSSFLFANADGSPIEFYIRPCEMKKKIRPLVENGGGEVTSKASQHSIRLAEPGSVSSDDYISTDVIFESIEKNVLQDFNKYRLGDQCNKQTKTSINPSSSDSTTVYTSGAKGRKKYTPEEDKAIIDFIDANKNLKLSVTGNKLWKMMEDKKVTDHGWQSMRQHYIDVLMCHHQKSTHNTRSKGEITMTFSSKQANKRKSSENTKQIQKKTKTEESEGNQRSNEIDETRGEEEKLGDQSEGSSKMIDVDDDSDKDGAVGDDSDDEADDDDDNDDDDRSTRHGNLRVSGMLLMLMGINSVKPQRNCTIGEMSDMLYKCSGSAKDAEEYLDHGPQKGKEEPWDEDEDTLIYNEEGVKDLIKRRGKQAVRKRKAFLDGFEHGRKEEPWHESEDDILIYNEEGVEDLIKRRGKQAVRKRKAFLDGFEHGPKPEPWTAEEDAILEECDDESPEYQEIVKRRGEAEVFDRGCWIAGC